MSFFGKIFGKKATSKTVSQQNYNRNIVTSKVNNYNNIVRFENGTVYLLNNSNEFIIGYYDSQKVYDIDREVIGRISISDSSVYINPDLYRKAEKIEKQQYKICVEEMHNEELYNKVRNEIYSKVSKITSTTPSIECWFFGGVECPFPREDLASTDFCGQGVETAIGAGAAFLCLQAWSATDKENIYQKFYATNLL